FRDAFPGLIDLFDSAVRAVAALDEPAEVNPLAATVATDRQALEATGVAPDEASRRAGYRIFGSKPGAYGAGLQTLIDERICRDARQRSMTPIIRSPTGRAFAPCVKESGASCAAAPPIRAGSPVLCGTATRALPRSLRRSITSSPLRQPHALSTIRISTRSTKPISAMPLCAIS